MKKQHKAKALPRGKARMRSEIVDAVRGLHKIDAVGDADLKKTTLRMQGKAAPHGKSAKESRATQPKP